MVGSSWVDLLMRNTPMRWDSYWWAHWRRIAAVVNIQQVDIQGCRASDNCHMCHLWSYMMMQCIINKNNVRLPTLMLLLLLSIKLCVSLSAHRLLELCRAWRTDSPAPRVSACCHDCAFVSHLAEVPSNTVGPPQHSLTDGVLSKPSETRVKQALPSPGVRATGKPPKTCDYLLWTATGGCMRAQVWCVNWTASHKCCVDITLIESEIRRVNTMLESAVVELIRSPCTAHWKTLFYQNVIQLETREHN